MTESMADFKQRIALLMRNKSGGEIYSMIGAAHSDKCVVRQGPKTYGHNAWDKPKNEIKN
jgi:hypothetical protein